MAVIFIDGFDKYGVAGQSTPSPSALLVQGEWTTVNVTTGGMSIVQGLSLSGCAIQFTQESIYSSGISKTLTSSYTHLIGGFRVQPTLSGGNPGFAVSLNGTTMWSISIANNGIVYLYSYTYGEDTVTNTLGYGGAMSENSIHFIEFDVTIGDTAAYQVWLDGISIIEGTGYTGSSAVNMISFTQSSVGAVTFDDFYLFDNTGSTNNAALLSNPRVQTQYPSGSSAAAFTNYAMVFGAYNSNDSSDGNLDANTLYLRQFVAPAAISLNSLSFTSGSTELLNIIGVLYADNAGVPGSLIAVTAVTTTVYGGEVIVADFESSQSLVADTAYWIGFLSDTNLTVALSGSSIVGYKASMSYSTEPSSAPSMTGGQQAWQFWGNGTTTANWTSQTNNPSFGDLSYVASSSPGATDLYAFPDLVITPSAIYTVAVKSNMRVTDSGNRSVNLLIDSNSITSSGSNPGQVPYTSYGWQDSFFDTDPNTSAAWTQDGLDNATAGFTVAS